MINIFFSEENRIENNWEVQVLYHYLAQRGEVICPTPQQMALECDLRCIPLELPASYTVA